MIKKVLRRLFDRAGYQIISKKYIPEPLLEGKNILQLDFDHVLSKYLTLQKGEKSVFSFLQIGAFDGVVSDPLYKYLQKFDWHGLMLEPQREPYHRLKKTYEQRSSITIKNVAISNVSGKAILYTLDGADLPPWTKGMASFRKNNILKHQYMFPDIEDYIRETEVDSITFEELLFHEYNFTNLDLLQVDVEGFDAEILNIFPFTRLKPHIIHFESKHVPKPVLEKLLYKLISLGYTVGADRQEDMMAVLDENRQQV